MDAKLGGTVTLPCPIEITSHWLWLNAAVLRAREPEREPIIATRMPKTTSLVTRLGLQNLSCYSSICGTFTNASIRVFDGRLLFGREDESGHGHQRWRCTL